MPDHPAAGAADQWHLAGCLVSLHAGVDRHWPGRDKRSDGGIGDPAHAAQGSGSDHNPWLNNTVRAFDFTATQPDQGVTGVDGAWLAEQLRLAGLAGDRRLTGGGYVIYNRHITVEDFSRWVAYDGDPHTSHVHVSASRDPAGYEDARPWLFLDAAPLHPPTPPTRTVSPVGAVAPTPAGQEVPEVGPHPGNTADAAPAPLLPPDTVEDSAPPPGADATGDGENFRAQWGNRGPRISSLQEELNRFSPLYSHLELTGVYDADTAAVIEDYARRIADNDPSCPPEHRDGLAAADGYNIGPKLAAAFTRSGIKP